MAEYEFYIILAVISAMVAIFVLTWLSIFFTVPFLWFWPTFLTISIVVAGAVFVMNWR